MSEAQETNIKVEYIDESLPPPTSLESRQSNLQSSPATTQEEDESKKLESNEEPTDPPDRDPKPESNSEIISTSTRVLEVKDLVNTTESNMADGRNEARALRVLEIMNDFRTLQIHINSLVTRPEAEPPNQASFSLEGYVLLRQCNSEAQSILATQYNPGSLGIEPGRVPNTEVQKATLQRIILDAATRRLQAHKCYLLAAAGMRWVMLRKQILSREMPRERLQQALAAADQKLRQERSSITDESVMNDLRNADRRHGYWVDEDPSLERMLAWVRRQR